MHPSRILTPFRRLRWKLTLSYTLVTVAAVLALEVVALCALVVLFSSAPLQMQLVQEAAAGLAEEVRPYLSATPPDRAGLESWLRATMLPGTGASSVADINVDANLQAGGTQTSLTFGEGDQAAVVNPSGEALVASSGLPPAGAGTGESFADPHAPIESGQVVARALRGEPAATRRQDRTVLVAQPVLDGEGRVLGVVYLRIVSFSLLGWNLLAGALGLLGGTALIFTVGAGIIGTLFGLFTAHGLVRRLGALSDATAAWGRGDFSATVQDTSADEIGQLSRRLDLMAAQIQDLLQARQELAALEERNRLARELHDSVKQQVFATTLTLGAAETLWARDPEAARQKVEEALALSRQSQKELTGLIHELRPVSLEGRDLVVALREHLSRWSRQTGISASVTVEGGRPVPLEVEQAFFRVAQEALANVARHSGARHVEVALSFPGDDVVLQVSDDGHGFVPASAAGRGMGLRSMRERIEALGGDLDVESAPGEGTRVTARCQIGPAPEGGKDA